MKTLLSLLVIALLLISCERKSGKRVEVKPSVYTEKVVILDSTKQGEFNGDHIFVYVYKVKRIEKGVVDYVRDAGLYDSGDTILVTQLQFK